MSNLTGMFLRALLKKVDGVAGEGSPINQGFTSCWHSGKRTRR